MNSPVDQIPPSESGLPPIPRGTGRFRHRLVSAIAICAILLGILLTSRFSEPQPRQENQTKDDAEMASSTPPPAPPSTPPPAPPSIPQAPDTPADIAAAHGIVDFKTVGILRFTAVVVAQDGSEILRRSWQINTGLGLVTSLDNHVSYLAENVTDQLEEIDCAYREDSALFLLPFKIAGAVVEQPPDGSGLPPQLLLKNAGPAGENVRMIFDESGLLSRIELMSENGISRRFNVAAFSALPQGSTLRLPGVLIAEDGSSIRFESVSVEPQADPGEAAEPEPWPSVERPPDEPEKDDQGG